MRDMTEKTPASDDSMVAALLREREGYARAGKKDRVAEVDKQLGLRGYKSADDDARKSPPEGRSTRPQQKASEAVPGEKSAPAKGAKTD